MKALSSASIELAALHYTTYFHMWNSTVATILIYIRASGGQQNNVENVCSLDSLPDHTPGNSHHNKLPLNTCSLASDCYTSSMKERTTGSTRSQLLPDLYINYALRNRIWSSLLTSLRCTRNFGTLRHMCRQCIYTCIPCRLMSQVREHCMLTTPT